MDDVSYGSRAEEWRLGGREAAVDTDVNAVAVDTDADAAAVHTDVCANAAQLNAFERTRVYLCAWYSPASFSKGICLRDSV